VVTVAIFLIAAFVFAASTLVHAKVVEVQTAAVALQSRSAAEAGLQHGIHCLRELMKIWGDFEALDRLDPDDTDPSNLSVNSTRVIFAEGGAKRISGALADSAARKVAEYDVRFDVLDRAQTMRRNVVIWSQGFVPDKASFLAGARGSASSNVYAKVRVEQQDGQGGNYAYFINHWGWFHGSSITANGSVSANGRFSLKDNPTINCSPIYGAVNGTDLQNRLKFNGITPNDGGLFAGLDIEGTCRGSANLAANRYEYQDPVMMPNLSNLGYYEAKAKTHGSTLKVGTTEYTGNGVYGDAVGEKQHLYLAGTQTNPIRLNGTVVVRGSLIIKGYVTGQGSIVAGGNIYVAGNLTYVNGPTTQRPASNDEATTEAWLASNLNKDFLGLYARENILFGNYNDSSWSSVYSWLADSQNRSDEDCGLDLVYGTGDEKENDGQWEIERYTADHDSLGVLPPGAHTGDNIPGTGEDIDGDGVRDIQPKNTTEWKNLFAVPTINTTNWGGNTPAKFTSYADLVDSSIGRIDGCLYTNHVMAGYLKDSSEVKFFGSVISRNEALVFTPKLTLNHDERLTGRSWEDLGIVGGGGKVWRDLQILAFWTDSDGS